MRKIKKYETRSGLPNLNTNLILEPLADNIHGAVSLDSIGQFEEAISLYGKVLDVIPNEIDAMFYMDPEKYGPSKGAVYELHLATGLSKEIFNDIETVPSWIN